MPVLPAWSVHVPETDAEALSGSEYVTGAVHDAIPDIASVPANVNCTACEYHPSLSAARAGVAVTDGGVASYLIWNAPGLLVLPALSRQTPPTVAVDESGPPYATLVHDAMPEPESDPTNVIVTAWLYQPFESAGLLTDADVTVGGVVSILNCSEKLVVACPSEAEQLYESLLDENVTTDRHVVLVAPWTVMSTVTALVYQPLSPFVPDWIV